MYIFNFRMIPFSMLKTISEYYLLAYKTEKVTASLFWINLCSLEEFLPDRLAGCL